MGLPDEVLLTRWEAVVSARERWQRITLRIVAGRPAWLRVRNMHAGRRGSPAVRAAMLRDVP